MSLFLAVLGAITTGFMTSVGLFPPLTRSLQYSSNVAMPNAIPELDILLELYRRRLLLDSELEWNARNHGYSSDWISKLKALVEQYPSIDRLIDMVYRGLLSYEQAESLAGKMGFTPEMFGLLYEAFKPLPALNDLIRMVFRGSMTLEEARDYAEKMGLPGELFDKLYEASKPILDASILLTLYYRKEISEEELRENMKKHGWSDDDVDKIVKASLYYPSPADIVRFAVREVFTPEIAEKYGLAEDMPEEYLQMARKAGLSEEFARWYWMAHWELPSINMGFEMFHRGIISREELETLLRVLDVMPYWRDKLIELSYELPTRVDVRRMYSVGVIDDKQLYEYYLKMGYSPEDAERLTIWTRKEYLEDERVLTKSQIKELYIIGELSLLEASRMLQDLGYSEEEVGFITTLWNHEKLNQMQKEAIEYLLELYKNGIITYEQLSDELNKLNLKATTLDIILLKARRMRVMSEKLPSESKIISWYKRKIISRDEFVSFMRRLGYSDQIIGYYLREMRE